MQQALFSVFRTYYITIILIFCKKLKGDFEQNTAMKLLYKTAIRASVTVYGHGFLLIIRPKIVPHIHLKFLK